MNTSSPSLQAERWSAVILGLRSIIRRFWWVPLLTSLIGLAIAEAMVFRQETWYRSTAKLMVSGRIQVSEGNAYSEEGSNFFGTQLELMKSTKVLEQAEARIRAEGKVTPSSVSGIEVSALPNTTIFVLRVTARTAEYSQAFLDALIAEYIAMKRVMRTEKSETTISALADEMLRLDKDRQSGEDQIEKFQREHSLVFLREGENTAAKYLAELSRRLADLNTQARLFDHLELDQLRGLSHTQTKDSQAVAEGAKEPEAPDFITQTGLLKAQQQVQILTQKKAELSKNLREDHPDLVALDEQIAEQNRLLAMYKDLARNELEVQRRSLASQIKAIQEEVDEWNSKALEIGKLMGEYSHLQAKVERSKTAYDRILSSIGAVDLTKNLGQDVVSVLERPSAPEPVRPGMNRNLLSGAFSGFLVGACILFLLDRGRAHIASPEEFVSTFEERLLGIVPKEKDAHEVLRLSDSRHGFAEAFFNLRSSLLFLDYDGPAPKILLVTSSIPNEGKSTLSANIALAFAFAGSKTILIDGDLRRGELHEKFGIENNKGLSEVLQRQIGWREAVFPTDTPNFSVMPRGGRISQPSKYLVHRTTDDLLREIHQEFDQIVIDSCPVLAADDTTSLAPKADAVLVVARIGVVSRRHLQTTLNSLRARQANVLGCILNGVDSGLTGYNYSSYAQYFNHDDRAKAGIVK